MAGFKIFLAVVVISTAKDGAYSCSLRSHKTVPYQCSTPLFDSTSKPHHRMSTKLHTTTLCHLASESGSSQSSISPNRPNDFTLYSKPNFAPNSLLPDPGTLLPAPGTLLPDPGTLLPAPGKLLPAPGTLLPAPGKLLPAPGTLLPAPGTLLPAPGKLLPAPGTLLPAPGKLLPAPGTPLPAPGTLLPAPGTLLLNPGTLIPAPLPVRPPKPFEYSSNYLDLLNILNKILSPSSTDDFSSVPLQIPSLPIPPGITRDKNLKPHGIHFSHAPLSDSNPCSLGILPSLPCPIPPLIGMPGPTPSLKFPFVAPVVFNTNLTNGDDLNSLEKPSSDVSPTGDGKSPKLIPLSDLCSLFASGFNKSSVPGLSCNSSSSNTTLKVPEAAVPGTPPNGQWTPPTQTVTELTLDVPSDLTSNASTVGDRNSADLDRLFDYILSSTQPPKVPGIALPLPPLVSADKGANPYQKTCPGLFPKQTLPEISVPTGPMSGVSSGYNPAFMQLLINRLLSKPDSPLSLLSLPCFQPPLTNTPVTPSSQNPFQTSTPTSNLHTSNTTPSDKSPDSNQAQGSTNASLNLSLCNNPDFTNLVCKLLLQSYSNIPKTHPCLTSLNLDLKSLFNTTPPVLNDLRDTLPGLASNANTSSPNPFSVGITSETFSESNTTPSTPALRISGSNLCRQKLARKQKLPCLHNIARPISTPEP